jgi:hypothetical protein
LAARATSVSLSGIQKTLPFASLAIRSEFPCFAASSAVGSGASSGALRSPEGRCVASLAPPLPPLPPLPPSEAPAAPSGSVTPAPVSLCCALATIAARSARARALSGECSRGGGGGGEQRTLFAW